MALTCAVGRTPGLGGGPLDAAASAATAPSGHALTAVVGCAVIVPILAARVAAVVISLVAGACRVLLGVHYVSDVIAGWILGMAIVLATVSAAKPSVE